MIQINVSKSIVSVQETQPLYSGSAEVHTCRFTFDPSWDSFSKSAVFRVGGRAVTAVVDENGCCVLPWELLARANIGLGIEVGVYGVSAEAEVLTSVWDSIGTVRDGTELGNDAREPSAGVYEQVMASIQRVDGKVEDYTGEMKSLVQRSESATALAVSSAEEAAKSENTAESAAADAQDALKGVQAALDNIPEGGTLVINDLTTGGAAAALSAEMGKVLGQKPNPNLLHNWYFLNPVNQRGLTAYTGVRFSIDRWAIRHSTAAVEVVENGLAVTDTVANYIALRQTIENFEQYAGMPMTLSVLVTEVTGTVRCAVRYGESASTGQFSVSIKQPGLHTVSGVIGTEPYQLVAYFSAATAGASATITAVKLELGSTQTLAHQDADGNWVLNEIPDYNEELRKCQRYFQAVDQISSLRTTADGRVLTLFEAYATGRTSATATLSLPVPMRTTPAVSWSGWVPTVPFSYLAPKEETDSVYISAVGATVTDITARGGSGPQGRLNLDVAIEELPVSDAVFGLEPGTQCEVAFEFGAVAGDGKLYLDAEL